ncbi:ankyrin repeat and MYND domain-containing protein 2 [Ceratitis capitata]|uniref:ankyrin repeat and MYND domain-containing protein 2 n=1 Tax=Ceratitis capitata TaxID=7213 RepID=UPI0003299985|nr:ankyrin repeat and MYND domain-containing protein 2 [Ceratitis capitata]XP_004526926.1 ankyrin repeat and MYND domain-containing protein 2 [Ceratitis capitata]
MEQTNKSPLDDIQRQIFDRIAKNDVNGFKQLITQLKERVDFVDDDGMTPLQHACCKGSKEIVQILLDMGADIHFNKHGADYTPLHFAALSGNTEVCRLILDAGINPNSLNSVSRTASQMAAFVGNHSCVETINNYVPRKSLEYYTQPQGQQKEPLISPSQLDAFHQFVIEINLHPVRIALNLQQLGLLRNLQGLKKALEYMCEKEMKKTTDVNELMAFKFHYLRWIVSELMRCEEQCKAQRKEKPSEGDAGKHDFVELFIKRVLKENKLGQLDYVEFILRECVREFPFRECTIFRQVVSQLTAKDPQPALLVFRNAINGHRGFADESTYCSSCGNEKPDKKCSKCKQVKYCDRECQRLHWFMHKKTCARPTSNVSASTSASATKEPIDTSELQEELSKLATA